MASGRNVYSGAAASNRHPIGTRLRLTDGPRAGETVTVEDRIGHGSDLDLWTPSCSEARNYGRRRVGYEVVP